MYLFTSILYLINAATSIEIYEMQAIQYSQSVFTTGWLPFKQIYNFLLYFSTNYTSAHVPN